MTQFSSSLLFDAVQITDAAARACYDFIGRGDKNAADKAATDAMRLAFDSVSVSGVVVIGEGEMDEAPMLYIGEKVGMGGVGIDIAVDPLEGTKLCADAAAGSMTTLAIAPRGTLLHAPDIYMNKIAVGAGLPENIVSLTATPAENIMAVARAKHIDPSQIGVCILDRPRHQDIINSIRSTGARIVKITDGDVGGAILTADPDSGIDIYMGSGGAPEGVLAAAALKAIGGQMFGQLMYEDDAQRKRAKLLGIQDPDAILSIHDMVKSDCIFVATGVTTGAMIQGMYKKHGKLITETFVANSFTKKFYKIIA